MKLATFIGTTLFGCLLATASAVQAQSPWNSVATRGDAEREAQVTRAARALSRERDCKAAIRQIREAAAWYEARPGLVADPRIPLIAARASACLGDSVTAARNFGIYNDLGGTDPDLAQEFGAACRAVFGPSEMPVDSLEAVSDMRELRADSVRLAGAVARVRPGASPDTLREVPQRQAERTLLIKAGNSIDPDQTVALNEPPMGFGRWRKVGAPSSRSRSAASRLIAELERVEAKMSCLRAAW